MMILFFNKYSKLHFYFVNIEYFEIYILFEFFNIFPFQKEKFYIPFFSSTSKEKTVIIDGKKRNHVLTSLL